MPNPFGSTFESFGAPRGPLVEAVHQKQFKELTDLLDSGEGQLISLRAPRAGYGKTMLLSRLRQSRQAQALFVPIHLADGRRVEGEFILEEILTQMTEVLPAGGGLTRLDLHTRKLFSQGLVPMVYSGEVPCQDREGALASLRERPTEAFDFHHEGAAIAQWSREQFAVLGPRLSAVLCKASGTSGRDVGYWTDLFFNFSIRPPSDVSRAGDLMNSVFGERSRFHSGAGFLEGLGSFLNLITLVEPVVLVLDEVEGLSSDSDAALRAASCLTSLWEAAPRVSVILSVNDDVWDSAFAPRLPLGLRDRLEDVIVRLDSLTTEEAKALITIRAGDEAGKVIERIDLDAETLYPRGLLREAREAWDRRDEPVVFQSKAEVVPPVIEEAAKVVTPVITQARETVSPVEEVDSDDEIAPLEEGVHVEEVELAPRSVPMVQYRPTLTQAATEPEKKVEAAAPVTEAREEVAEKVELVSGADPSQFKTHPTSGMGSALSLDELSELHDDDDFAQPTQQVEVAKVVEKKVAYPPNPVSRPVLPRKFMVQRLVPAISVKPQAEAVLEQVVQTAPVTEAAAIVEPEVASVAQPVPEVVQARTPISSPFSINPDPKHKASVESLPPVRPTDEPIMPKPPELVAQSPFTRNEPVEERPASVVTPQASPTQASVATEISPEPVPDYVPSLVAAAPTPFEVASEVAPVQPQPVSVEPAAAPTPFEVASEVAPVQPQPVSVEPASAILTTPTLVSASAGPS